MIHMKKYNALLPLLLLLCAICPLRAVADSAAEIDRDVDTALQKLARCR